MDDFTIRTLNEINRRFYKTVADEFDSSRQRPWQGWERLLEAVGADLRPAPTASKLTVLDVGCGNGRFGRFLADRLGSDALRYLGLDSSAALLARAKVSLSGMDARFEQRDIVDNPPDTALGQFDWVVLFGVLHHIPGADRRLALLHSLSECVAPAGRLVFTEWRFYDVPHLRERIIPWGAEVQVEPGDYLLDWRRGATSLRYCHAVDDGEHARLVAATELRLVDEFRADAANLYTVLQRDG